MTYLVEVEVFIGSRESVFRLRLLGQARQHLVEHMVVALPRRLGHYPTLFEKIFGDSGTSDDTPEK